MSGADSCIAASCVPDRAASATLARALCTRWMRSSLRHERCARSTRAQHARSAHRPRVTGDRSSQALFARACRATSCTSRHRSCTRPARAMRRGDRARSCRWLWN